MMKEKLLEALNQQVNAEYYSAYLYLAMSAHAERQALKGTAHWLNVQAQEEMAHAFHIYRYILERGETPAFLPIQAPPAEYSSIFNMFEAVLDHEQSVTASINTIATLALQESDHACYQFMMWYVNEQVEEEGAAADIVDKLKMIGDDKGLIFSLDSQLATRTFVHPFPADLAV